MALSVLFVCNQNSIRSPMAAQLLASRAGDGVKVDSAGVYEGAPDPFLPSVLKEVSVDLGELEPKSLDSIDLTAFDCVVALTVEAVEALSSRVPPEIIEYWPTENPTESYGARDQILAAYRRVRDDLIGRLSDRFGDLYART